MKITKDGHITIIKLNKEELADLQEALLILDPGTHEYNNVVPDTITAYGDFFGKRESDKPAAGKPRSHKTGKK